MAEIAPLATMLSKALVAFTIEFDNEFEHQMAHRTTLGTTDGTRGPWLASQVMWSNVMQYVTEDGVTVHELHARAHTARDSLAGLRRWGYVVVRPAAATRRTRQSDLDAVVRPTAAGRRAQETWQPLAALVERRWEARFGRGNMRNLRDALVAIVDRLGIALPAYVPIIFPAKGGRAELPSPGSPSAEVDSSGLDLSALMAKVLLAYTLDFERDAPIALPISADGLRVLGDGEVRVRDLPGLTGVSKEANAMLLGFLERHGCAVVEPDPSANRGKIVRLTEKGAAARRRYRGVLRDTETAWQASFGGGALGNLRRALHAVVGDGEGEAPLLREGLRPYPDGWRARLPVPPTLPHYPMVLHRGGYPDGS